MAICQTVSNTEFRSGCDSLCVDPGPMVQASKAAQMTSIASKLPQGLSCYRETPAFTRDTVPAALLGAHNTKAGVWGLLRVLSGRVQYHLDDGTDESVVVAAGETVVIEPQVPHHVELLDDDSSFHVAFHRAAASP